MGDWDLDSLPKPLSVPFKQTSRQLDGGAAVCLSRARSRRVVERPAQLVAQNATQLLLDRVLEGKGVEPGQELFQSRDLRRVRLGTDFEPGKRGGRLVIDAPFAAACALGAQMLHDRTKKVAKKTPFFAIQLVEQLGDVLSFQSAVTHQLTHMGPVLLFHPRVVILSIGARAGEADRDTAFAKVVHQMPVEELATVVGIEAQDGEGQG